MQNHGHDLSAARNYLPLNTGNISCVCCLNTARATATRVSSRGALTTPSSLSNGHIRPRDGNRGRERERAGEGGVCIVMCVMAVMRRGCGT